MVIRLTLAKATSSSVNLQNIRLHDTTSENGILDFVQGEQTPEFGNHNIYYFVQKADFEELLGLLKNGEGNGVEHSDFSRCSTFLSY
jgi:hypothetical protein